MKTRTRWILPGLAIAMLIAVARVGLFGEPHSAASLLDSATQRLGRREPDYDGALRQLGLALELALETDDHEIAHEILLKRARAYRLRGDHDLAFADAERLLLDYSPDDPEILALAGQMALEEGRPEPALDYARRFLETHPTNALASLLVGEAHSLAAQEEIAGAVLLLREALGDAEAERALQAVNRASALPAGDPRRLASLDSLDAVLGNSSGKLEVFRRVERATEALDLARQAYFLSLADGLEPEAVEGLLAIATRSERLDDAVLLGRAFLAAPPTYSPTILLRTVEALRAQGRDPMARQLVSRIASSPSGDLGFRRMETEELAGWLRPLYELALWKELDEAASLVGARSRQLPEIWRAAQVYWGTALLQRRNPTAAMSAFERAFRGKAVELSPENTALAWLGAAEAARKLGDERDELAALREAVRVPLADLHAPEVRARVGEALYRLAEEALGQEDPTRAEVLYTQAMSLLPKRLERIQPRWEEAGRRAMAEQGRRFRDERGRIETAYPDRRAGPYELWLYAESYLRQDKPYRCLTTTDRLLNDHPGFPLGLRAAGEAHLAKGDLKRGATFLVDYLEAGGPEEDVRELLEEHPFERIPPELKGRLLRAAPHVAGTLPVARELVAAGRKELALAALGGVEAAQLSPEGRILRARLASELGRWEDAHEILVDLPAEGPLYGEAAGLAIHAAIKAITRGARLGTLKRSIDKVRAARDLDFPELLGAADALLAHGHESLAIELLAELDSRYSFFRGEVVMRLAVAHVVRGEFETASQYIARAEPFFDGPDAPIGRLAIAADLGSWDAWDLAVREVLAEGFPASGFPRLLAIALQGHHATAIEAIDAEVVPEDEVPDPRPMLLRLICEAMLQEEPADDGADLVPSRALQDEPFVGRPGEGRDPRHALTLLAALEHPSWAGWAVSRLRALRGTMGRTPWPLYLIAEGLHRLGQTEHAEQLLHRLTKREPPVPFAWLLLERITRERAGDDTPELLALRRDRIDSFGPLGLGERDRSLVLAFVYDLVGNREGALQVLEEAAQAEPDDLELALRVARKLGEEDAAWEAIQAYDDILARIDDETRRELIPEYLDLLQRAAAGGELSVGAWWALLESMETQIPDDPSIARELAARTIDTADERADWGVSRAWERLGRFRRRTGGAPVDELRPGEAARWFDLYAAHDPEQALGFAQGELERLPTRPALWLLLARGQLGLGRVEEALATIETITTIVPDPDLLRFRAQLALTIPLSSKRVRNAIDDFQSAAKLANEDPEMTYLRGTWMAQTEDEATRNRGIQMLSNLYEERAEGIGPVDGQALGTEVLIALLERNREADLTAAVEVAGTLLEETAGAPLRAETLAATRALAEQLSLLAEEQPAKQAKKKRRGGGRKQNKWAPPTEEAEGAGPPRRAKKDGGRTRKRAGAGGGRR